MSLEPGDTTRSAAPLNPYSMQHQRIPPKEVILETQKFVRENPGTFEELHRLVRDVSPTHFEGVKIIFNRGLSQYFQSTHTLQLGDARSGKYSFGATYVGDKEVRAQELSPVLIADMDSQTNLNFQSSHNFSKRLRARAILQTQKSSWSTTQLDATYYGDNFTVQNALINVDPNTASGIMVSSYLRRLRPNFDAGAEIFYQRAPGGAQQIAYTTLCARLRGGTNPFAKPSAIGIAYPSPKWTAAASVGVGGWHLSYHRNCSEHLQVGVDYEFNRTMNVSDVSFNYCVDIPKNGFNFKASLSASGVASSVTEVRMQNLPFAILFAAVLNCATYATSVGIGVNFG